MSLNAFQNGVLSPVTALFKQQDGSLRTVSALYVMRDGSLQLVASFSGATGGTSSGPMTASVSPDYVNGYTSGRYRTHVVSDPVTVTPSGGVAPYRYSCAAGVTVDRPGYATTTFSTYVSNSEVTGTFTFTVMDAVGSTATVSGQYSLMNEGRTSDVSLL